MHADHLDDGEAVFNTDPSDHPMYMVLHGLLREVQLGTDFLVGEPFSDQGNQLLLAAGQAEVDLDADVG